MRERNLPLALLALVGCANPQHDSSPVQAIDIQPIIAGKWSEESVLSLVHDANRYFRPGGLALLPRTIKHIAPVTLATPEDGYKLRDSYTGDGIAVWFVDATWPDPKVCEHCIIGRGHNVPIRYAFIPSGAAGYMLAHEIGHALGLGHNEATTGVLRIPDVMSTKSNFLATFSADEFERMVKALP